MSVFNYERVVRTWPRKSNNVQNVPPVGAGEILGRLSRASLKCYLLVGQIVGPLCWPYEPHT